MDLIVSPYEADPQLAFMCNIGSCDYVITEDSDLTCYGCNVNVNLALFENHLNFD
jgi:exonuclease 1